MKRNILTVLFAAAVLFLAGSCESKLDIPQHSVVAIDDFYQTDV